MTDSVFNGLTGVQIWRISEALGGGTGQLSIIVDAKSNRMKIRIPDCSITQPSMLASFKMPQ